MVNPSFAVTATDGPIAERLPPPALLPTQPEPGPTAVRPLLSLDGPMLASASPVAAQGPSGWTVSAMPRQEATIARDGEAVPWADIAIALGFVCVAAVWFAHMRRRPSSLDRTGVRRRPPPLVDLDEVLED